MIFASLEGLYLLPFCEGGSVRILRKRLAAKSRVYGNTVNRNSIQTSNGKSNAPCVRIFDAYS